MTNTKSLWAETFGTFWLVFGGCGSAVLSAAFPQLGIGFAGVSLAFELTVLTMAYAVATYRAGISIRRSRSACGPAGGFRRRTCCPISSPRWSARSSRLSRST